MHYKDALTFAKQSLLNNPQRKKSCENIVGKEKMLVPSIFSFSHTVFCSSLYRNQFLSQIYLVICKVCQIGLFEFLAFGKD